MLISSGLLGMDILNKKKVSPSLVSFSCDGGGWAKSDVDDNDNETSPSFKFVVVSGGGSVDKTSFRFLSS